MAILEILHTDVVEFLRFPNSSPFKEILYFIGATLKGINCSSVEANLFLPLYGWSYSTKKWSLPVYFFLLIQKASKPSIDEFPFISYYTAEFEKFMSMLKIYLNHRLKSNPRHREELLITIINFVNFRGCCQLQQS